MINPLATVPRMREPRQDRSRISLERILRSTEALLARKRFEDITIAEIVRRSRTSVGAFYTRFDGKEALLPSLYDRYDRWIERVSTRVFKDARWDALALDARVRRLTRLAIVVYRRRRGLIRAMALHARARPQEITATQRGHRHAFYEEAAALLLQRRDEITHPRPEQAVQFALLMLGSVARERILFADAPHAEAVPMSDRRLAMEIADAMHAYLQPARGPEAIAPGGRS